MAQVRAEIEEAHTRLVSGKSAVDQAHAEARLFGAACKTLDIQLAHARMTGRLEQGSDLLPDVRLGESAAGSEP